MRMQSRPSLSATMPVVPAPPKGSRTAQGTTAAPQRHDGDQPRVVVRAAIEPRCGWPPARACDGELPRMLLLFGRRAMLSVSVSRFHGAPHLAQQPRSLVPALMHGSMSDGGKVAK